MNDPLFLTQPYLPPFDEYSSEIRELWNSYWITTMGRKHSLLTDELKSFLKVKNLSLFSSGHTALEATIRAFELKGEIITTPFTFASTTHAIINCGLNPKFCDIHMDDYTIDISYIESLITPNTSAIIPVHPYGNLCDIKGIDSIAKKYGLKVIYDAAHTFGIEVSNQGVSSFGDASIISFHASKVFHTAEGGAVAYSNDDFKEKLELVRNFGVASENSVPSIGLNGKMNELEAAMGLCCLRHFNEIIAKRKSLDKRYRSNLYGCLNYRVNQIPDEVKYNYSYFPIIVLSDNPLKNRDVVYEALHQANIFARKQFFPLTCDFECYHGKFNNLELVNARYVSTHILCLPLHTNMTEEDVDRVCEVLWKFPNI